MDETGYYIFGDGEYFVAGKPMIGKTRNEMQKEIKATISHELPEGWALPKVECVWTDGDGTAVQVWVGGNISSHFEFKKVLKFEQVHDVLKYLSEKYGDEQEILEIRITLKETLPDG